MQETIRLFKKEWRTILILAWLCILTLLLLRIDGHVGRIKEQSAKTASTVDTIESVAIGADAGIVQLRKQVGDMESNMNFVIEKLRRR